MVPEPRGVCFKLWVINLAAVSATHLARLGRFCGILIQTHVANSHSALGQLFWFSGTCVFDEKMRFVTSKTPHRRVHFLARWIVRQCACVCHRVLQCVAVCCSVAACFSVLQCVAVCCRGYFKYSLYIAIWRVYVAVCCSLSQCASVCCNVLQCVAVSCSVLRCVAECYNVFRFVVVNILSGASILPSEETVL